MIWINLDKNESKWLHFSCLFDILVDLKWLWNQKNSKFDYIWVDWLICWNCCEIVWISSKFCQSVQFSSSHYFLERDACFDIIQNASQSNEKTKNIFIYFHFVFYFSFFLLNKIVLFCNWQLLFLASNPISCLLALNSST